MAALLDIQNLQVALTSGEEIVKGVNLTINRGQVHAIMGPNGSGKSTLSLATMGHPSYEVTGGKIMFDGADITEESVDVRAKNGLFLAVQYPYEIEGLVFKDFLRQAYNARYANTEKQIGIKAFNQLVSEKCAMLGIDESFVTRHLNVGFSGGEKKRAEMLQLAVLQPKLVILDEIDSGLDIDALKHVANALQAIKADNPDVGILIITHYKRILEHIEPDYIHVMQNGKITQSGDSSLADTLEAQGYN